MRQDACAIVDLSGYQRQPLDEGRAPVVILPQEMGTRSSSDPQSGEHGIRTHQMAVRAERTLREQVGTRGAARRTSERSGLLCGHAGGSAWGLMWR